MKQYFLTFVILCIHFGSGNCDPGSTFGLPKNCGEIDPSNRIAEQLTYIIYPHGSSSKPSQVVCDFETDGGNWTVIQQRNGGPLEEFYLDWIDYEEGFGDVVGGNFWLGLKTIHALTSPDLVQQQQELRIELGDWEEKLRFAQYKIFSIANATDLYRLTVGGFYDGDVADALTYHNGMPFSTKDADNDLDPERHCAQTFHGAWWYQNCYDSNLNGFYFVNGSAPNFDGIAWGEEWDSALKSGYSLKTVQMKIRDYVDPTIM